MGSKLQLPTKLQESIDSLKRICASTQKRMDKCLEFQFESRQEAEQDKNRKKTEGMLEENIAIVYFFEQFHSPRFWKTVVMARQKFKKMQENKLEAVN